MCYVQIGLSNLLFLPKVNKLEFAETCLFDIWPCPVQNPVEGCGTRKEGQTSDEFGGGGS